MILGWFDARAAEEFGAELARSLIAKVPADAGLNERKFEARAKSALTQLGREVAGFRLSHTLNLYKKARLSNAFKWALKDAGYDQDYIDKLTDWLVLQLQ